MKDTGGSPEKISRVAMRLPPPFWAEGPAVRIAQAEAHFTLANVRIAIFKVNVAGGRSGPIYEGYSESNLFVLGTNVR
jgi:hypothetical protein